MDDKEYYGDELMNMGITLSLFYDKEFTISKDFASFVTIIEAV
jgi:alpha-galactosidase